MAMAMAMGMAGYTILVVDDEPDIREVICMHLAVLGVELIEAGDGQQALDILRSCKVDVVVSDISMPHMTGLMLLSGMRAEQLVQPFIFLTAFASHETTVQALRLGAFDFVEKPCDASVLLGPVKEALRVAGEMQRLSGPLSRDKLEAKRNINMLRTLRFEATGQAQGESGPESNSELHKVEDLFIAEATNQLVFCGTSIKGLGNPEECVMELGYLFRVMQSLAVAAASIGAARLVDVLRAAEHFYTALRVRPSLVIPDHIALGEALILLLNSSVPALGKGESEAALDAMIASLNEARANVETAG